MKLSTKKTIDYISEIIVYRLKKDDITPKESEEAIKSISKIEMNRAVEIMEKSEIILYLHHIIMGKVIENRIQKTKV